MAIKLGESFDVNSLDLFQKLQVAPQLVSAGDARVVLDLTEDLYREWTYSPRRPENQAIGRLDVQLAKAIEGAVVGTRGFELLPDDLQVFFEAKIHYFNWLSSSERLDPQLKQGFREIADEMTTAFRGRLRGMKTYLDDHWERYTMSEALPTIKGWRPDIFEAVLAVRRTSIFDNGICYRQ